jgi:hypothetical protein
MKENTMNKAFRLILSKAKERWVIAAEIGDKDVGEKVFCPHGTLIYYRRMWVLDCCKQ